MLTSSNNLPLRAGLKRLEKSAPVLGLLLGACSAVTVPLAHADNPAVATAAATTAATSAFQLGGFFADHMVLQRSLPITVWGDGAPGADVSVTLGKASSTTKAGPDGRWRLDLPALAASGPYELKASSAGEAKVLKDVMVGDVWLVSGQSNVVLTLSASTDWAEEKKLPASPAIRICKLPADRAFEPAEGFKRAILWQPLDPAHAGSYLSGVGYYFVKNLQPKLGVTVGLVEAAAGGTQVEQWTPLAAVQAAAPDNPLLAMRTKTLAKLMADPAAKIGLTESGAGVIYDGTIAPFHLAKLAGVLWYQGEANSRSPRDYRPVLTAFVRAWRVVFDEPNLPFVLVQLPNFGLPKDDGWMRVQEAQLLTARDLDLGLAVTIEQGSKVTIHPPNKAEVGRRAALAALQHVYKQDVEGTSPLPKSVKFAGDSASVEFEAFKGDLVMRGSEVKGFELAGADGKYLPAIATLQGRSVTVKAAGVAEPKSLRYLWANSPEAVTLFSAAGLPATPFRSQALAPAQTTTALRQ